ncbi:ABC transporter substrate-binding protein [Kineococcus sp. R8]|uniref:ABC transporter substrate-binding protein n=1 Tax=Kineococcus siccus TaxID=2696567 RepID=UPI0014136BAF|nr:ABC transporter substrate-binding protein [Kineococcus siccus]NAZ83115.1 ABC transporter substrate-binding protein [Kineococcus siccus]
MRRRHFLLASAGAASAATLVACSSDDGGSGEAPAAGAALVVDNAFDLKTADPARSFELTGALLNRQTYETALTFQGSDVSTPVPQIASFTISDDARVVTLKIEGEHKFADGSLVDADDIVFSYQRLQGIKGNPSFLLDGVEVRKVDAATVELVSADANPALPSILPNPSLGILNSELVKANGGTTDDSDGAETFLNGQSAGSAAYQIDTLDVTSQVTLKLNPAFVGTKPTYSRIVLENVPPATQKINVQSGTAQIATDLNAEEASGLAGGRTAVISQASAYMIFGWFNTDPRFGGPVSDPLFVQAVRHALDYAQLGELAGAGSVQPGGVVPSQFVGTLAQDPSNTYDVAAAKDLLGRSSYDGQEIQFLFSNDVAVSGVQLQILAQAIQSQLKAVGITIALAPKPSATSLDSFRSGEFQAGLAYWGPDFPDPSNYLAFTPGQNVGLRAGWTPQSAGAGEVVTLVDAAKAASGPEARGAAYEALQRQMNVSGPFVPIVQPAQNVVTAAGLEGVELNPIWTMDLAAVR